MADKTVVDATTRQKAVMQAFGKVRINHPEFRDATQMIDRVHSDVAHLGMQKGLLITGASGAGKSFVAHCYAERFESKVTEEGTERNVVYCELTGTTTPKGFCADLFVALGDPVPPKGTLATQTNRLVKMLKSTGTQLVIVDEIQHMVRGRSKVLLDVADWLKSFFDKSGVALVLIGMRDAKKIFSVDEQLARRFLRPLELKRFRWDGSTDQTAFLTLLKALEGQVPISFADKLGDPTFANRMFLASEGRVSRVIDILKRASLTAVAAGRSQFTTKDLAAAYEMEVDRLEQMANPFLASAEAVAKAIAPQPSRKKARQAATEGQELRA